MTHRFSIKEVAAQAGVGTATVDRVLNKRAHVSARTIARVHAAFEELAGQEAQLAARGRQVWVDVVAEAPERFSREIRLATEAAVARLRPAVVRARFQMQQVMDAAQTCATLDRVGKRGSHGVCLKARDVPDIRRAVARLRDKGIPVVTLVTDIAGCDAYAGVDNAQAGRTAAALIAREVSSGQVMLSASREDFAGEAARLQAFKAHLTALRPNIGLVALSPSGGLNHPTGTQAEVALARMADLQAVYSVGGGNRAIVAALARHQIKPRMYVAHDLDTDNRLLLAQGTLSHVLHHDLQADVARALQHILAHHRLQTAPALGQSQVQIIIAENLPAN